MTDFERFLLTLNALEDVLAIAQQKETLSPAHELDRLLVRVEARARDALRRLDLGASKPTSIMEDMSNFKDRLDYQKYLGTAQSPDNLLEFEDWKILRIVINARSDV